jgi:hypothetical protein
MNPQTTTGESSMSTNQLEGTPQQSTKSASASPKTKLSTDSSPVVKSKLDIPKTKSCTQTSPSYLTANKQQLTILSSGIYGADDPLESGVYGADDSLTTTTSSCYPASNLNTTKSEAINSVNGDTKNINNNSVENEEVDKKSILISKSQNLADLDVSSVDFISKTVNTTPRKTAFNPLHVILKDKNKYHTTEYI